MELNIPQKYRRDIETAASLLKKEGGKTVYLFGSMVTGKVHKNSDIDIGVKGLPAEKFFKVYSKLYMDLDNKIDLVDFDYDNQFFALLERIGEIVEIVNNAEEMWKTVKEDLQQFVKNN